MKKEQGEFNLVEKPWIKCDTVDEQGVFHSQMLSLKELFSKAHEVRGLAGESPAQDVAMLRFLLSVLHAVYTRTNEYLDLREDGDTEGAIEMWGRLYTKGYFDMEIIGEYLATWKPRFYLFHPERPFYQVADLKEGKATNFSLKKLIGTIAEPTNTPKLNLSRNPVGGIDYSEAARWLLSINALDDGAVKGGTSWVGRLGNVTLRGENLFETLLLNFILYDRNRADMFWEDGVAAWELDVPRVAGNIELTKPSDSQVEHLTLQSRRLYLVTEQGKVVSYKSTAGDKLPENCDASIEQYTRLVKTEVKKREIREVDNISNPQHFWRGFPSIVVQEKIRSKDIKPGVLRWLDELLSKGYCEKKTINIDVMQVVYGKMSMAVDTIWSDTFQLNTGLFTKVSETSETLNDEDEWLGSIEQGLSLIQKLANTYGFFIEDLARARGKTDKLSKMRLNKQALLYTRLGEMFYEWLASVDPTEDEIREKQRELVLSAYDFTLESGKLVYIQSGDIALMGSVSNNGTSRPNLVQAYNKFKSSLNVHMLKGGYKDE